MGYQKQKWEHWWNFKLVNIAVFFLNKGLMVSYLINQSTPQFLHKVVRRHLSPVMESQNCISARCIKKYQIQGLKT